MTVLLNRILDDFFLLSESPINAPPLPAPSGTRRTPWLSASPVALGVSPDLKRFLDLLEEVADVVELLYQLGATKDARELETLVVRFLECVEAPEPPSRFPFPAARA